MKHRHGHFGKNRIDETSTFGKLFPAVKFVFFLDLMYLKMIINWNIEVVLIFLPDTGDGDLEELCDKYFTAYNVDIAENQWIKNNLRSPIAVKLFCDIYCNQKN